jgi:hypothetical protein
MAKMVAGQYVAAGVWAVAFIGWREVAGADDGRRGSVGNPAPGDLLET